MTTGSAAWIAAVRGRESLRSDRLFDDPYAHRLAGAHGVATMHRSEQATGSENAYIPVRVKWFDDSVIAATTSGIGQVVLLGAGMDTRPYRLDLPSNLDWYEVDRAHVIAAKDHELHGQTPRCRRHPVVADVTQDWTAPLLAAGLDPERVTVWLAEGLLFYLAPDSVATLLRTAATICASGSLFLADVLGASGLNTPVMRPYRDWCARTRMPAPFGVDDPTDLFSVDGWLPDHIVPAGGPDANYGRLPPQPDGVRPGSTHLIRARRQG